ncbi:MAG: hypothetical protein EOO85_16585 [Pedobacter sp.]|nr:MAG: hypothetical protein EOO85_16585 [Pedobacter sp.]
MRKLLNAYFGISRKEYNGMLILTILIAGIAAVSQVYDAMVPSVRAKDHGSLKAIKMPVDYSRKRDYPRNVKIAPDKIRQKLFVFDPNTIGIEEWQSLGLSARQSAAIINYRNKGGKFKKAEDLQKMYTISDKVYKRLFPYVSIKSVETAFYVKGSAAEKPDRKILVPNIIEVNLADSAGLLDIKGIGPAFASRIIKYRERVGGFYKKEQLMEVFGLDSMKFKEIKNQVSLDTASLRKFNINTALVGDFKNHPYIRYKQANALVQYRKQHGGYRNIADLSKVLILDAETINRLAPYLNFK